LTFFFLSNLIGLKYIDCKNQYFSEVLYQNYQPQKINIVPKNLKGNDRI